MDKSQDSGYRQKKTEGLSDMWSSLQQKVRDVGQRIQERRDARETTWDKIVRRGQK